ncbi:MAG: YceI family protein [Myxococcota bacterium]
MTPNASFLLSGALAASLPAAAAAADWEIDAAHTTVSFSVKHMMVTTVRGTFANVAGSVSEDERSPTKSKIDVTIDPASIHTGVVKRDDHLRSADFFDVAKHPVMTFRSTRVAKAGAGYKVTGDLTMHGVTRPVVLTVDVVTAPIKNPYGQTVRGLHATAKINRKDWGLGWNAVLEAGGVAVGESVKLEIDAELVAKTAPKS